ncbi:MAG: hypothetical protein QXG25_00470 [Nitrososphaerota archaeon]
MAANIGGRFAAAPCESREARLTHPMRGMCTPFTVSESQSRWPRAARSISQKQRASHAAGPHSGAEEAMSEARARSAGIEAMECVSPLLLPPSCPRSMIWSKTAAAAPNSSTWTGGRDDNFASVEVATNEKIMCELVFGTPINPTS